MANQFIEKYKEEFGNVFEHYEKELNNLRIGRANPSTIEEILVDAYGVKTPLKQMTSISVPEARVMNVEPWDKNLLKEVEKALTLADLGYSISGDSTLIRVIVPQMTEENRKDMVKVLGEKMEAAKVSVKSIREKVKEEIIEAEKASDITEDDKYAYIEELDKKTQETNKQLQERTDIKEKEIITV